MYARINESGMELGRHGYYTTHESEGSEDVRRMHETTRETRHALRHGEHYHHYMPVDFQAERSAIPARVHVAGDRGVYQPEARNEDIDGKEMPRSQGHLRESKQVRAAASGTSGLFSMRGDVSSGMYTGGGRYRSIRDLVSQLWFDDMDEATSGAEGLCDLCVPSNPQAAVNREVIGATPTFFEGCERLIRSGSPNAIYHACEALSQVAFNNSRNALRIMECRSPSLLSALAHLLEFIEVKFKQHDNLAPSGPMQNQEDDLKRRFLAFNALSYESKCDLQIAILRTLNNCAWVSSRACNDIVSYDELMSSIELTLMNEMHDSAGASLETFSQTRVAVIDSIIGLFILFTSNRRSREVLRRRRVLEDLLLPLIQQSEDIKHPSEQVSCTIASIFEIVVKLIPEEQQFPFLPDISTLKTIVWTLQCALDGIIWAGITWSPLSRLQTLSRLAEVDEIKIPLVELHLPDLLVRVLEQWSREQGEMLLEHCLHTLLCLMTVQEVRFQLYMTGVWSPLRNIVLGEEGVAESAREKAMLCSWLLFEWQVEKLEVLDRSSKTLIEKLEECEQNYMALERDYSHCKNELLQDIQRLQVEAGGLRDQLNHTQSDLMSYKNILENERSQNLLDREAANSMISSLKRNLMERDERLLKHEQEISEKDVEINYWKKQAEAATLECRSVYEDYLFALRQRDLSIEDKNKALELAEVRYHEMILQQRMREESEIKHDAQMVPRKDSDSDSHHENHLKSGLEALIQQLSLLETDLTYIDFTSQEEINLKFAERISSGTQTTLIKKEVQNKLVALGKTCNVKRWKKLERDCYALWLSLENCQCGSELKTPHVRSLYLPPQDLSIKQSLFYHSSRGEDKMLSYGSDTPRDLLQSRPFSNETLKRNLLLRLQSAREKAVSMHEKQWKRFLLQGEEIPRIRADERRAKTVVEKKQFNLV
uniref:Uncharacterized protein n=2 Tax=Guillardia theta TaxID=55529 RepID=A0A7S4U791_GUITH|mmetsp:Transcript_4748/g.17236  ORF Transcript_4748/g.17236 Transcript_4748/m.17236 type:complete len:939 (+) Transcript_4748:207-3023(+)